MRALIQYAPMGPVTTRPATPDACVLMLKKVLVYYFMYFRIINKHVCLLIKIFNALFKRFHLINTCYGQGDLRTMSNTISCHTKNNLLQVSISEEFKSYSQKVKKNCLQTEKDRNRRNKDD